MSEKPNVKWDDVAKGALFEGNRDRSTVKENRLVPIKCQKIKIMPVSWHRHICMRVDILGCSAANKLSKTCVDRPYLDAQQRNCRAVERSFGGEGYLGGSCRKALL